MTKPETEQRRFHRLWADGTAVLTVNGTEHRAPLVDLSLKGVLIRKPADLALAADAPVALVVLLGEGGPRIAMEGRVAHVEPGAIGICWQQIDLDSISELRRFVELNLGDSDVLNRELSQLFT
jgi:hypothetical protein